MPNLTDMGARLWRRPWWERRAIVRFALLLGAVRALVRFGGVPRARRAARLLAPRLKATPERAVELIRMAAQGGPGLALCLPRSIVLEATLVRAGWRAELRIGVAPRNEARVDAHAWVEIDGVPVGENASAFTPLPVFGA